MRAASGRRWNLLTPVYSAFTEGPGTPDFKASRQLLDELEAGS
jgi:hypothetical protein